MPTPLKGTAGTLTHNGVSITWVGKWDTKPKVSTATQGPYVGDANEYEVSGGIITDFDIEADVPSGKDAAQTAMLASLMGQTNEPLVLTQTGGYTATFSAPLYKSGSLGVNAKGTQSVKISGSSGLGTCVYT
jgi:hypothetical protein